MDALREYITTGLFPSDPKRVPACIEGELTLPLKKEACISVAEKQRTSSPEERHMIREETKKLMDRGYNLTIKLTLGGTMPLCEKERRYPTIVHRLADS